MAHVVFRSAATCPAVSTTYQNYTGTSYTETDVNTLYAEDMNLIVDALEAANYGINPRELDINHTTTISSDRKWLPNTFYLGDGTTSQKTIEFETADATKPQIFWDPTVNDFRKRLPDGSISALGGAVSNPMTEDLDANGYAIANLKSLPQGSDQAIVFTAAFAAGGSGTSTDPWQGGIQEAINALPDHGGIVILAPGVTTFCSTISTNKPIKLTGATHGYSWNNIYGINPGVWGPSTLVFTANDPTKDAIVVQASSTVSEISGVIFEGFQLVAEGSSRDGIFLDGETTSGRYSNITSITQDIAFRDVLIGRFGENGIHGRGTVFDISLSHTHLNRNLNGLYIEHSAYATAGPPSQIRILNESYAFENSGYGFRLDANDVSVVHSGASHNDVGIGLFRSGPQVIVNCHMEANTTAGIRLEEASAEAIFTVVGGICKGATYGIEVKCRKVTLINSSIIQNTYGIWLVNGGNAGSGAPPNEVFLCGAAFFNNTTEDIKNDRWSIDGINPLFRLAREGFWPPYHTDGTRPAPGQEGRIIYNRSDKNLNIDDGVNWILPDGTIT